MILFRTRDGLLTINLERVDYVCFDSEEDWLTVFLFGNSITLGSDDALDFLEAWKFASKRLIQASRMGGVA